MNFPLEQRTIADVLGLGYPNEMEGHTPSAALNPRFLIRIGTLLFSLSIAFAYAVYPHWVTLSDFAAQWYTLIPFTFAMVIAMLELWYIAAQLRQHGRLATGAVALYTSAIFVGLVVCIPYRGSAAQKDIHDATALLFALSAAFGFASMARRLRNYMLGMLSGALFGICALELIFLARYNTHPVRPWVWTMLEVAAIASLIAALDITAKILDSKSKAAA